MPELTTKLLGRTTSGRISIRAGKLELFDGAQINASTFGTGDANNIEIDAREIFIQGNDDSNTSADETLATGIVAGSQPREEIDAGDSGIISIRSEKIELSNGGSIATSSHGSGDSGSINLSANQIRIRSGAFVSNFTLASGAGAKISINSHNLDLEGEAAIDSISAGTGTAGNIEIWSVSSVDLLNSTITTEAIETSGGNILIFSGDFIQLIGSQIDALANQNGGDITLTTSRIISLQDSRVSAEAVVGNGGNISIDPEFVTLNNSQITANAILGNGGNIDITTDFLIQSEDSSITASSRFGFDGTILISGPELDLTGNLNPLAANLFGSESRLPEHCSVRLSGNQSSFIQTGKGGLPWIADLWQSSFNGKMITREDSEK